MHKELDSALKEYREISVLGTAMAVLHWDMETMMPKDAVETRAAQIEVLTQVIHRRQTDPRFVETVRALREEGLPPNEQAQVRQLRLNTLKSLAAGEELSSALARVQVEAHSAWKNAKKEKNFKLVEKELSQIVKLQREYAAALKASQDLGSRYAKSTAYEVHLDAYEPGFSASELRKLLSDLVHDTKDVLAKVLEKQAQKSTPDSKIFAMSENNQYDLGIWVAKQMGLNFDRSRLDTAVHPFCSTVGDDTRITTRYKTTDFTESLLSVVHETGHALYEQNIPRQFLHTPCGTAASAGIHESQSRFCENIIGRSRAFCDVVASKVKISGSDLFDYLNRVEKTYIRTESDEVTYNLHIYLRYLIEEDLMNGKIEVQDLPELWRVRFKELFGIEVPDDSLGFMQDTHWYGGAFGYFPTYSLGNMLAAELFIEMKKQNPSWSQQVQASDWSGIRKFLTEKIHSQAAFHDSPTTIRNALGRPLGHQALVSYFKEKYQI